MSFVCARYLRLEVKELTVVNRVEWVGGGAEEAEAVHLETVDVELEEIRLVVVVNDLQGPDIIQQVEGLSVQCLRPLRDLWHRLPLTEFVVKVRGGGEGGDGGGEHLVFTCLCLATLTDE